jgi:hypothetical protein
MAKFSRHDETDEYRPARSGGNAVLLVVLAAGGLIFLACAGVAAVGFFTARTAVREEGMIRDEIARTEAEQAAQAMATDGPRAVALKEPAAVGGVTVRVVGVRVGKVTFESVPAPGKKARSEADETALIVEVELTSEGGPRRTEYHTWRDAGMLTPLSDDRGNSYLSLYRDEPNIVGATNSATLHDGRPVRDLLAFAVPVKDATVLHLDLPGKHVGVDGTFRFAIPRSAWEK